MTKTRGQGDLTVQQLKFMEGLLRGKSKTEAYRDAYPGCTNNASAATAGGRLLQKLMRRTKYAMPQDNSGKGMDELMKETAIYAYKQPKEFVQFTHRDKIAYMELLRKMNQVEKQADTQINVLNLYGEKVGQPAPQQEYVPTEDEQSVIDVNETTPVVEAKEEEK